VEERGQEKWGQVRFSIQIAVLRRKPASENRT
jgi:hypothetical protein